jgi:sulfatase maturation enzyme AslB (radical SAM superfamily)
MKMKTQIKFVVIPTYKCNLEQECSYCYAKESSQKFGEMKIENFKKIVDWLSEEYKKVELVLIGGEPTTHPAFDQMLNYLSQKVKSVKLYTNGLFGNKKLREIINNPVVKKFNMHYDSLYINTPKTKERFFHNLDKIYEAERSINLRYNISHPDFEYSELIKAAEKYNALILYSISAPGGKNNEYVPLEYVGRFIPRLKEFLAAAEHAGIRVKSARPLPYCAFESHVDDLDKIIKNGGIKGYCQPYKAINPDMTMLGCSSLIDFQMIKVNNKDDFMRALHTFDREIDALKWEKPAIEKCKTCDFFAGKVCQGGCLTYKGKLFNKPLDGGCLTSCSLSFYEKH